MVESHVVAYSGDCLALFANANQMNGDMEILG